MRSLRPLRLEAAAAGFCLAGGYAVQAHGFVDRVSKDVDLFTTMAAAADFPAAQTAVVAGLEAGGLAVVVEREGATFARLAVSDASSGETSTLELGVDWRAFPPVQMAIGPVLHPVDAAANKLCALFGRAAVRDYIDVHGSLVAGHDELALADHCLTGFLRIVTHPRIFSDPAPTTEALPFVDRLRQARRGRPVTATPATWDLLAGHIAHDRGIRGNLVPDAYLAALAASHGCRLATADRGFARYAGLEFFDPVGAEPDRCAEHHA